MDPQLLLFRRQYLQLFEADFLAWPPKQLVRDPHVQAWLYRNLFDADQCPRLPPERYQFRVLKPLLAKIEQAIEDPEEDVGQYFSASLLRRLRLRFNCTPTHSLMHVSVYDRRSLMI